MAVSIVLQCHSNGYRWARVPSLPLPRASPLAGYPSAPKRISVRVARVVSARGIRLVSPVAIR